MNLSVSRAGLAPIAALVFLAGCQSQGHAQTDSRSGRVAVCGSCYDEITKVRRLHPHTGLAKQTIRTHMCTTCKSDLVIYAENGVLMAKCAACAPDGVACDLCVPKAESK